MVALNNPEFIYKKSIGNDKKESIIDREREFIVALNLTQFKL